jgi:outer membrane immunogenic protein
MIALATAANASDVYSGGLKDTPIVAAGAPVMSWTGFYVGGNVGVSWESLNSSFTNSWSDEDAANSLTLGHTNANYGFAGGAQLGYNYQVASFLLGVEADFGYAGADNTYNILTVTHGTDQIAVGTKLGAGFLTDVDGRLGFVSGPALFYIKGGWSYFDGSVGTSGISAAASTLGCSSCGIADDSKSGLSGVNIGGGIEYLMNPSWSIKAEYLHHDFGSVTLYPVATDHTVYIHNDLAMDTVTVGLNYHFNASYVPLK